MRTAPAAAATLCEPQHRACRPSPPPALSAAFALALPPSRLLGRRSSLIHPLLHSRSLALCPRPAFLLPLPRPPSLAAALPLSHACWRVHDKVDPERGASDDWCRSAHRARCPQCRDSEGETAGGVSGGYITSFALLACIRTPVPVPGVSDCPRLPWQC